MTMMKKIACYRPYFYPTGSGGDIIILAIEMDENLPEKLRILSAEIKGNQLRFESRRGNLPTLQPGEEPEAHEIYTADTRFQLHKASAAFSDPQIKAALRLVNGGMDNEADLLSACNSAIIKAIGASYPDAAISFKSGTIVVESKSALPLRTSAPSRQTPMGARRRSRASNLHVWI